MKILPSLSSPIFTRTRGFTLIEMLVVVAILGVLAALVSLGMGKAKDVAEAMKNTANLKQITMATINWAADNGSRLPSPQYPGGMKAPSGMSEEDFFPENYNLGESRLWLDGVVFAELYLKENKEGMVTQYKVDEKGTHLQATLFECTHSVKKFPEEDDWHRHTYAMNANLQYDRIYDQVESENPYLTEKTLSNLLFAPNALLYIECIETNVVLFENRENIIETITQRWDGGKVIASYLDGHADRLSEMEIPEADPLTERVSSRFWRGIDPPR